MNDIDEQAGDSPLIEEPETKINKLKELFIPPVPVYPSGAGLISLVGKVIPYGIGKTIATFNYLNDKIGLLSQKAFDAILDRTFGFDVNPEIVKRDLLIVELGFSENTYSSYKTVYNFNKLLGNFVFVVFCFLGMSGLAWGELANLKNRVAQQANKDNPVNIPDVNAILSAHIKQLLSAEETSEYLSKHGFDTNAKNVFLDAIKRIPDIEILFQNLWRGKIDGTEMSKYLAKLAFDEEEQILITNLAERIPPIQDLIRFSVREAFHEELSKKYRHDEEFPKEVATWAAKQGFPEHWAKKYWRSHWELPSVQMAFEMMHREVKNEDGSTFTQKDIHDLLKMADYAPSWRKKLVDISYRVITRVDARRMYDLGVWDNLGDMSAKDKLLKVYMSQGYNREDAGYMVDFTEQYHIDRRRGFTKAGLKKIYKYGIITETTFREKLAMMRIRVEEIDFLIDEANYEMEDKKLDSFMNMAKSMFQNERWSEAEVQVEMSKVDLHISNPDNLFDSWRYDKKAKRRTLSKVDIKDMISAGIIGTKDEGIQAFLDLGYSKQDAEWLTQLVISEIEGES